MGSLSVHGTADGSLSLAEVIAPFQVPPDNEIMIEHVKITSESPSANTRFVTEKSTTQDFAAFSEIDRTFMPDTGTYVSTQQGVEVPSGFWVRVRYIQSAQGAVSCTLIGKSRRAGIQIP